ncbi:uncharacterized protein PRCAT00003734001 [Priceomyces carsonii]|uniref:uncharacterized protein n=1 Tax=Priceomyces carsonii TaxID=28549 RepID=UPI002ED7BBFA|nr:unnamed protein product [Priceomyces carsonii]
MRYDALIIDGKFVRASKYRHVYGQAAKKELCYENLKITKNAWDSNIIHSNGKYISVNWDASGGGAFAIIPLEEVGKAPDTVPLFRGHKAAVLDTAFDPFNLQRVASCSDDGKICIWDIPEGYSYHKNVDENNNVKDVTEPVKILSGHTRKVGHVEYHPCAQNILASCSMDYTVKIWNVETGKEVITLPHKDMVTSFSFNYNGSLLATASRDKKIRIWDIREQKVISEGPGHTGAKPSRVAWLGNTDRIVTTGFSKLSDRQVGVWDIHHIEAGPIDGFMVIDSTSGVLIPIFDDSTSILFLAGKGDGNIRYYEYDNDVLYELSQYSSTDPQRGFCVTPKNKVNVKENEILRSFKTVNDQFIEPISFIVPRRSELFQSDIYPDCPSNEPALSADEWLGGKTVNGPLLMSMESLYEGTTPSIRESGPATVISSAKEEVAKKKEDELSKKQEQKETESKTKSKEVVTNEVPKEKSEEPKNVDDVLKSSEKVDDMLNKVIEKSDDEDAFDNKSDEDWEEIKEPVVKVNVETPPKDKPESLNAIDEIPNAKENTKTKEKIELNPKRSTQTDDKSSLLVTSQSSKESAPASSTTSSKTTTTTPTLKATVEKLANLVEKMEAQITKLEDANNEKDSKLDALLKKVEDLNKQ